MIVQLNFYNPISNIIDTLDIKYPVVEFKYWQSHYCTSNETLEKLESLLNYLDATRVYDCGRPIATDYLMYKDFLSDYIYYILKIDNQLVYNEYIDKLIQRHVDNLIFESNYVPPEKVTKKAKAKIKRNKAKYITTKSNDMFTGETIYYHENVKTHEIVRTKTKSIETTKTRSKGGVPISAMTFSFAKKK